MTYLIPHETLTWWRELVDLNPQDLAPRIDAYLKTPPAPQEPIAWSYTLKSDNLLISLTSQRWNRIGADIVEQALYAHPPPPVEAQLELQPGESPRMPAPAKVGETISRTFRLGDGAIVTAQAPINEPVSDQEHIAKLRARIIDLEREIVRWRDGG